MRTWNPLLDLRQTLRVLLTIPPRPQPLRFESLSLKTPAKTIPPAPGTALQQKIESKLKKSLGSQFNIQVQQQMEVFQASMLEAMKSQADSGVGLCLLQERFRQRHLTCHYLLLDQTDRDPML